MGISETTNGVPLPPSGNGKKAESTRSPREEKDKDKVELSSEAKSLFEAGQNKRLEEIRTRIKGKYYFQRDVTEQVATALIKDLMK